jgi:4'-phosphopantetheinyl transferase
MHRHKHISIERNEVHVWMVNLAPAAIEAEPLYPLLSGDERVRAGRFCFVEHAKRYTVARASLRRILSRYTNVAPGLHQFKYGANGKPFLPNAAIRFNLSHSSDLAVVAIAHDREVGIDVEQIRRDNDLLDLAEHFFAPDERAALRSLSAEERYSGFFRCWTSKEAYLKARGDGLSIDLHAFSVSLGPNEPAALIASAEGPAELRRWRFAQLDLQDGYAAALAVEGRECDLRFCGEQAA